ncbi:MAG: prepilin-type N-terminal cleavage/methylation domain-containing protein [Peptoniphilus sp.]|nr:prepilin-type N-terminal cleavage/methylation domain-containing protein [Peptoniphilus sp.]MDY3118641.1 prepilin-type N-terminal cleavage/methylation domain-containing protein [Peptoniphilus sp.]
MKKTSFTLLEVMVAAAIVGLITVMLTGFLGSGFQQLTAQEDRRSRLNRACNTMESYMAYADQAEEGICVRLSNYDAHTEKVEVLDEKTGKCLLVALRPKESLYTP